MSSSRNLVVRRELSKSTVQPPLVLSLKALPVSLRVRSPDVAVRSAVHALPALSSSGSCPDPNVLASATRQAEPTRTVRKTIKLGRANPIPISWKADEVPTDSQLLQLADHKKNTFVLGFSALHWACEMLRESVVQSIIDRKLVHPNTFAQHAQFISFTPVFSAISVLWLRAEHNSEHGVKDFDLRQQEQSCLSIMKTLAAAGAKLDFEIEVHLHDVKCVTLLHIAADYACLLHGKKFRERQGFLLRVAQLLADNLNPSECALLFRRRCKVDGRDAVSVRCRVSRSLDFFAYK
jgi:hypothetical protein